MWWKMDSLNEGKKATSIVFRSCVLPPGYKAFPPSIQKTLLFYWKLTHQRSTGGAETESFSLVTSCVSWYLATNLCATAGSSHSLWYQAFQGSPEEEGQSSAARGRGRGLSGPLSRPSPCSFLTDIISQWPGSGWSSGEKPELSPGSAEQMRAMSLSVNDFSLPVSSFLGTKIKWIILFQMNNIAKLYSESYDTNVIITQDFYVLLLFERDLFYSVLFFKRNIILRYSKSPFSSFPT